MVAAVPATLGTPAEFQQRRNLPQRSAMSKCKAVKAHCQGRKSKACSKVKSKDGADKQVKAPDCMKFVDSRPLADLEAAAQKLMEIANVVESP